MKYIIFLSLFFLSSSALPQNYISDPHQKLVLDFSILESRDAAGEYITGNDSLQGFVKYNYGNLPANYPPANRMITLRSSFRISPLLKGRLLGIFMPPQEYPANIYLNGQLIGKRGDIEENYSSRIHRSKVFLLSPGQLNSANEVNQIAIQLYPKYGENKIPFAPVYISEFHTAATDEFWRNLLGPDFNFAVAVFSLIVFLYYIALYYHQRELRKKYYLYFGLLNLAISFSVFNNAFSFDYQNTLLAERISKTAYNLVTLFTVFFVLEFAGIFRHKRKIFTAAAVLIIPGIVNSLFQPYAFLAKYYYIHVGLVHIPAFIFVCAASVIFLIKKPGKYSAALSSVYCIELLIIFYDLYYLIFLNVKPYILIIPFGMFLVNVVLFFILAWEQAEIHQQSLAQGRKLQELSANLELKVEERTAQLNNTVAELNGEIKYREAVQVKLREANDTKDKLFSIISHDLKNVFNSVMGFSEIIIGDIENGKTDSLAEDITSIRDSSRRAYLFLNNLLEWSASQTGMLNPEPAAVELRPVITESTELFKMQAELKKISFELDIEEGLMAFTDRRMLLTILRNLISNAIKFSYAGGRINIKADLNGSLIFISVIDHGIGFDDSEEHAKRKTELDLNSPVKEKGTGIGLMLVKELLKVQESSLTIHSRPEKGSTFTFTVKKSS